MDWGDFSSGAAVVAALGYVHSGAMDVAADIELGTNGHGADNQFRTCELKFNWAIDETIAACGRPNASQPRVGGGECLFYENLSVALRTDDHPAPVMAACFVERVGSHMDPNTRKLVTEDKPVLRLDEVIGLSRLPN